MFTAGPAFDRQPLRPLSIVAPGVDISIATESG
jgi:hypothetical protein